MSNKSKTINNGTDYDTSSRNYSAQALKEVAEELVDEDIPTSEPRTILGIRLSLFDNREVFKVTPNGISIEDYAKTHLDRHPYDILDEAEGYLEKHAHTSDALREIRGELE